MIAIAAGVLAEQARAGARRCLRREGSVGLRAAREESREVDAAALGISIGNGCEALVKVADIVAPAVSDDGLAWALRAAGLTADERTGGRGLGDAR